MSRVNYLTEVYAYADILKRPVKINYTMDENKETRVEVGIEGFESVNERTLHTACELFINRAIRRRK
jgi:flagellar assembly factor FliW